jgi:prepilin peptidase CpaA
MHSFAWWPTVIVLGVATYTDLRSRRIPNWLVLPFFAVGVATAWAERVWDCCYTEFFSSWAAWAPAM